MRKALLWTLLPVGVAALVILLVLLADPLRVFGTGVPPVERLTVERTILDENGIRLLVRAGGPEPIELAQVQVDGAYWSFTQTPMGPIPRLDTAWLFVPYPWVAAETHTIVMLTRTGVAIPHPIDVAVASPTLSGRMLGAYGLVGLGVGIVPVALGMLFYPALRSGGPRVLAFALALTIGLLAFLLVDTMEEALAIAASAAPELQAPALVWLVAGLSFAVLWLVGRRRGRLEGHELAIAIALGIGLHNLGEGLAIGAAFATGAAALGTFLVLGFTLHNITEGIGIVAPLLRLRPTLASFIGLAALAGLPAVLGIWMGAYAFAPHWAALALAIGAGAILQVILEVGALLLRQGSTASGSRVAPILGGAAAGIAVMYVTALLVPL
jgi:ZIP family zinc transporter